MLASEVKVAARDPLVLQISTGIKKKRGLC